MASPEPKISVAVPKPSAAEPAASVTVRSVPQVTMSEHDAYIHERIQGQPDTTQLESQPIDRQEGMLHRLSLALELEADSYDCTRGQSCSVHAWKSREISYPGMPNLVQWDYERKGRYIFRWVSKRKRALDEAMNVRRWLIVNRRDFPHLPQRLFSINGAIEEGDSLLMYLPYKHALELRKAPGEKSNALIRSRLKPVKGKPDQVLMTANEDDSRYYMPKLTPAEEENESTPGLQEGRDFN